MVRDCARRLRVELGIVVASDQRGYRLTTGDARDPSYRPRDHARLEWVSREVVGGAWLVEHVEAFQELGLLSPTSFRCWVAGQSDVASACKVETWRFGNVSP